MKMNVDDIEIDLNPLCQQFLLELSDIARMCIISIYGSTPYIDCHRIFVFYVLGFSWPENVEVFIQCFSIHSETIFVPCKDVKRKLISFYPKFEYSLADLISYRIRPI